ncbi:MAG: UvrD-helicase domain-containing protein [Phycisphaerae bacterium]|nr:UvrD-helicase domain-containing protein [Phycisphaerae bacterium]
MALAVGDANTPRDSCPPRLKPWATQHTRLQPDDLPDADSCETVSLEAVLTRLQQAIGEHKFSAKGAPRITKDDPEEVHARRDRAKQLYNHFNEQLFKKRLQRVFGRFTPDEWLDGLERIAPYVKIVTQLVERYRRDYAQAKSEAGVLDFADLERKTYELLSHHEDVAAALRRRFRYVLVDEFQDINPLQEAIIRLVSREPERDQPDNLFVVGDVKQSIYRFRLAEPAIFLERQAALSDQGSSGSCIHLQRNYRSAGHIIDAVNHLFRRLLTRHVGGIEYDASAELRVGSEAEGSASADGVSVELHLLQRRLHIDSDTDSGFVDPTDPAEWSIIEREAYVIARRIRRILDDGGTKPDGMPLGYGDVAVLLRAARHTAAPMAQMLGALGIPACADVGGEFFSALEVRDILSVLSVLDNTRQDIPLAAVLRSPVLGDALNEDELLKLRLTNRDVPFHETVCEYALSGSDPKLRERVARILRRIDRYRDGARRRPLSETLWRIYHENGYLAHVGGLPNGAGRRANLLKLHEHARKFGTFQKQGLHRFLRFIESLKEEGRDFDTSPSPSASDNVVRVMSIHRSKGLEFPVVVLADLGRRFNLTDAAGRMIFDRSLGLGLRVIDRDRMIEYPSSAHYLVAGCVNKHTRAEELRVLYVALTRAMQRLILVGSAELPNLRRDYALHMGSDARLSRLTISMAATPLNWIVPALATLPRGAVVWRSQADRDPYGGSLGSARTGAESSRPPIFTVHTYEEDEMSGWALEVSASDSEKSARRAAAALLPLPPDEPCDIPSEVTDRILERLEYVYPQLAAASVPAVIAATEIRKRYDWLRDPDEQPTPSGFEPPVTTPREARKAGLERVAPAGTVSASEAGVITHRFLQHLNLEVEPEADDLRKELQRLIAAGKLTPETADVVDIDAVAWFLGTKLGNRIRASGEEYRREVMFVHRRPASAIDPLALGVEPPGSSGKGGGGQEVGDTVLIRGVIDGILPTESGVEIVDYKTDRIAPEEVDERTRAYAPQLAAYAAAAEDLFDKPVEKWWVVFLHPRTVVDASEIPTT